MSRIQTETGYRNVQLTAHRSYKIEVATGYDAMSDKWPIHVYLTSPDGKARSKVRGSWLSDSMQEAFDAGFEIGIRAVDDIHS